MLGPHVHLSNAETGGTDGQIGTGLSFTAIHLKDNEGIICRNYGQNAGCSGQRPLHTDLRKAVSLIKENRHGSFTQHFCHLLYLYLEPKKPRRPSSSANSAPVWNCSGTSSAGRESCPMPSSVRSPLHRCSIGTYCLRCGCALRQTRSLRPTSSSTLCREYGCSQTVNCCRTWRCSRPSSNTPHPNWSPIIPFTCESFQLFCCYHKQILCSLL